MTHNGFKFVVLQAVRLDPHFWIISICQLGQS